jgi:hypothetical protein
MKLGIGINLGLLLALGGCAKQDYVKTNATLGKVVVYRNGVAYFERRAQLEGNELTLSVPRDKVDDFLKSLTVRDAATGKSLPVSFPRKGTTNEGVVDMVVRLPETTSNDVILTYITDSPAWKPSYRIVIDDKDKVSLEGWAIVDNTSGENWKDVLVGVGSSSALSFKYDLWSIRDVHRQTLANESRFAVAPPQGASTYGDTGGAPADGSLVSEFSDSDINMPTTHPDRVALLEDGGDDDDDDDADYGMEPEMERSYPSSTAGGAPSRPRVSKRTPAELKVMKKAAQKRRRDRVASRNRYNKNQREVKSLASKLKAGKGKIVIEGYAALDESDKDARALDRANVLRNQLIGEGVAPAQIQVRSGGAKEGRPAGVRLIADAAQTAQGGKDDDKNAPPVGESHFQSATPMNVHEGSSVMVSIIKEGTAGEMVYLYDSESSRGNKRFAFKAVRFANPTKNTLESGPVTVYGDSRFVGEGLTDPIPPNSMAMVPFALDRQVVVERDNSNRDQISKLVKLERGVLTTEVQHIRQTKLKLTNRLQKAATVYVRHSVLKGWNLLSAPKNPERLGEAHLFPIELKAGETRDVIIEEATPMTKTLDLRARATLDIISVYLASSHADKEFSESMKTLLALHHTMADHQQAIESLRERMGDYRIRMDELHIQIVSLKAVRSGGTLLKHLQVKMKDISNRVHQATIDLDEHQEKLMLTRIKFQDAVAELSLADANG